MIAIYAPPACQPQVGFAQDAECAEIIVIPNAVDPPKIPADRKDGKQKASEASLHLMVIESYNMRPPQLSEYLSLSKLA